MSTLERAIAVAALGHAGQLDKAGEPYILHPLRVMMLLETPDERMAGVLHDVVEDCGWTLEALREEGFSEAVIGAVDAVTRRESEDYTAFIARAGTHPIGRRVKLADLKDNCDMTRLKEVTAKDQARLAKYRQAIEALNGGGD